LKIYRDYSAAQLAKSWIIPNNIKMLNLTDTRASGYPDIYEDTVRLLIAVNHLFFIEFKKLTNGNLKPIYPRTFGYAIDRLF